jgi:hypothetical protein
VSRFKECDVEFLKDVGYAIQFDAPGNHLVTEVCSGVRLFESKGDFINRIIPVFENSMGVSPYLQSHPYTDVSQIKQKGDFSCINFSCGYYNMHTSSEFVVVKDVEDAFNLAVNVVKELGNTKYDYTYVKPNMTTTVKVTCLLITMMITKMMTTTTRKLIGLMVITTTFTSVRTRLRLNLSRLVM